MTCARVKDNDVPIVFSRINTRVGYNNHKRSDFKILKNIVHFDSQKTGWS